MNLKKALLVAIISIANYTAINATFNANEENQIAQKVKNILEWANSQTEKELDAKKNTIQFLNPRENDDEITVEAKKKSQRTALYRISARIH